jgi:Protein of unknown function (DUF3617)
MTSDNAKAPCMIADMIPTPIIRRAVLLTSLSGLIAFAAPPLQAADRLTPGQYEYTSTIDGKTQTYTHCITPDDAKAVNFDAKAGRAFAEKAGEGVCTISAYDVTGDKVSYTMACSGSVSTSSGTYHGDSYEGDVTRTVRGITHNTHTKAKRVGACK